MFYLSIFDVFTNEKIYLSKFEVSPNLGPCVTLLAFAQVDPDNYKMYLKSINIINC